MSLDFDFIMRLAGQKNRKRLVISGEKDPAALAAVLKARRRGWVKPFACGSSLVNLAPDIKTLFSSADVEEARSKALEMIRNGEADALLDMGPLDSKFLSILNEQRAGIKTENILSYVSVLMLPKYDRLTLLTDTLLNDCPGLKEKVDIIHNVLRLTTVLGIERPKIAALAPLELVNPALRSTLDAAILSKMSERGQFGDAILEGPLAMDNAESESAARRKGINSPVPGNVDVYLFHDLESANLTAQFLAWVGRYQLGGIIGGTAVPVIIRSSLEPPDSWLLNIALCILS